MSSPLLVFLVCVKSGFDIATFDAREPICAAVSDTRHRRKCSNESRERQEVVGGTGGGEPHSSTWQEADPQRGFKKQRVCVSAWVCVRALSQKSSLNRHGRTFPPSRKMAAPLLEKLSESLGSPEPAVRLILSILIGKFCLVGVVIVVASGKNTQHGDRFARRAALPAVCNCQC